MYRKAKALGTGAIVALIASTIVAQLAHANDDDSWHGAGNTAQATRTLINTTQGPLWPPSTVTDKDGNFVVVGSILTQARPGVVTSVTGAALVSKDTVPPLDANGREDFSNPMAAPYKILHKLNLSPGSSDMNTVLYTPSYGPPKGNFGGGPRIPMQGDSRYNLNMVPFSPCPELFPSSSQVFTYTRKAFPLQNYPILGFQGDQVAYDVDTGAPFDPMTKSGTGCGAGGCPGENVIDFRSRAPITLGHWLQATGAMHITLTRFDEKEGAFTAARFDFKFKHLIPKTVYTLWAIRQNVLSQGRVPGPFGIPSLFVTDDSGDAEFSAELPNPFPDRATDDAGLRVIGVEVSYHPDQQNWGACGERWGVGYRALHWYDLLPDGTRDLSKLLTKSSS
jgi:hypothetical protein